LNQADGIDALFPETVLAGTEQPVLPFIETQGRIAITVTMIIRKRTVRGVFPELNLIEIPGDNRDLWNLAFQ
jgi:hypothetical protein